MKRKRDIQGKFTLKNHDYRQVRSLRLTESTWKKLGRASESRGMTRADLLENLVQQNKEIFSNSWGIEPLRHRARISYSCLVGKAFSIKSNTRQID